ncbi:MAG TPA: hypothetical protein DCO75_10190 [Fibrobacteres bacterium]|jgi:hypothetical protein|nr:hypothetical protein [Fibrobacterota bacterium]
MKSKLPRIDKKAFSVGNLNDDSEEKEYWLSKKPYERLEAVEISRRMVYGKDRATSRLQRFLETAPLSQR